MTKKTPAASVLKQMDRAPSLQMFRRNYHKDIEAFVSATPNAAELAITFPGLLFALATGFAPTRKHRQATRLISQGAPLKKVAEIAGVPWWLRRLPASSFTTPLVQFPDDADFHKRIATLIPSDPAQSAPWFKGVSMALKGCHPEFALWAASWLARQHRAVGLPDTEEHFSLMAAWAWHANAKQTIGHRLTRRLWTPQISLRRALEELSVWRQRMLLAIYLEAETEDRWLTKGEALGYDFVPLLSADDFVFESENMSNCLDQYADRFSRNFSRIFAIRKNGRSVANIEIGLDDQDGRMPAILQLRGPRNRRTSAELWRASYLWLGLQPLKPRTLRSTQIDPEKLDEAARRVWATYLKRLRDTKSDTNFRQAFAPTLFSGRRLTRRTLREQSSTEASTHGALTSNFTSSSETT